MKNIQVKDRVVVNSLEDTPIYRVKDIQGFRVFLEYFTKKGWVSAGVMDRDVFKKPSAKQIKYAKAKGNFGE